VAAGDAVVVDLADLPDGVRCDEFRKLVPRAELFAVVGPGSVDAAWLSMVAHPSVRVVQCDETARRDGYAPAVDALAGHLGGPTADELATCVLKEEPRFRGLSELVAAVCRGPGEIRRPADLARAAGVSERVVVGLCGAVGYKRVEHFLCAVRLALHHCLVTRHGKSSSSAWARAGVSDRSNFNRQVARDQRASRTAFDWGRIAPLVMALGLSAALLTGCCGRGAEAAAEAPAASPAADTRADSTVALPVVGALVRRGDPVLSVRATGAVRAERQVTLKVETQGTVAEVLVRPGERVTAGQVLVRLDPRPLDLAVREAEASLEEARMRLQDALIGDAPDDTSEVARGRREGARRRSGIGGAEARLERARLDRERAVITAPFGGTVDRVGVVAAQRVGPGEEIARLVDLSALTIEASVIEHDLPYVRAGGQASVVPSASPDTRYRGTIEAVLPVVDTTTRAGRVVVRVQASDGRLRPGMYADVQLEATRLVARVLVPAGAVIERDGRTLVFRARAGRAEWVYVPVGRSNGTETEILADSVSGRPNVGPGDTVLVGGHLTLTHDAPIRVRLHEAGSRP
jgi:membrane fusion protein (multidrug efflux system)